MGMMTMTQRFVLINRLKTRLKNIGLVIFHSVHNHIANK